MVRLGDVTGSSKNRNPRIRVITTENPPSVLLGIKVDSQLPTMVMLSTPAIITRPFFISSAPLLA